MALITLTAGSAGRTAETLTGPQPASLLEVLDGDTIRVRARIWLGTDVEILVRLDGVDAPELKGACAEERALAEKARRRVEVLTAGRVLVLRDIRYGKYAGRVIARVEAEDRDIGDILVSENLARAFRHGPRHSWCSPG